MPLHLTPLVRAWQCRKRGMCCRVHKIPVSEIERRRITRHLAAAHDDRAALMHEGMLEVVHGWQQLPRKDGACVFLEHNLCSLHARFGAAAIPGACRQFPHLLLMTDDRLVASLSFQCPTALELLAHAPRFETLIEPDGEPPTDAVSHLADHAHTYVDLAGRVVSPAEFWRGHWRLFERLAARPEPDPLARLIAFAEAETGERAPPPAHLPADLWSADFWHPGATFQLARAAGESAFDLAAWWEPVSPQDYTFNRPDPFDEDAFVLRYLLHRAFAPVFYVHHRDQRFLLAMLFGLYVRIRLERARGHDVTTAVRHTDRFFVHVPNPEELFGANGQPLDTLLPWGSSWRVLAALASSSPTH